MLRQLKEAQEEVVTVFKEYRRNIALIRARAEANRAMLPNHPIYQRQLCRDVGRGIATAGLSLGVMLGVGSYATGLESRSEKRAASLCVTIRCRENIIAEDIQKRIDPNTDTRVINAVSYHNVKVVLDQARRDEDLHPIKIGISAAATLDIIAGISLGSSLNRHRRRLMALKRSQIVKLNP